MNDAEKIVVLQNELAQVLGLSNDLKQMIYHLFDWVQRRVGFFNIALWLPFPSESEDAFGLFGYLKFTIPGEKRLCNRMLNNLMNFEFVGRETVLISDGLGRNGWLKNTPALRGCHVFALRLTYLTETLGFMSFFRSPDEKGVAFSEEDKTKLEIIWSMLPAVLMKITPSDDEDEEEEELGLKREDWWKRGEDPQFDLS